MAFFSGAGLEGLEAARENKSLLMVFQLIRITPVARMPSKRNSLAVIAIVSFGIFENRVLIGVLYHRGSLMYYKAKVFIVERKV